MNNTVTNIEVFWNGKYCVICTASMIANNSQGLNKLNNLTVCPEGHDNPLEILYTFETGDQIKWSCTLPHLAGRQESYE